MPGRGKPIVGRVRSVASFAIAGLLSLLVAACAAGLPRDILPEKLANGAEVAGFADVRSWGDGQSPALAASLAARLGELKSSGRFAATDGAKPIDVSYLALSGGGGDGAYGAGLLAGWTAAGTRPEFEMVTGVSTGALIAPFAFLGPAYDHQLKDVYTTIETKDIVSLNVVSGILGGDAIADSSPLAAQIARFVDGRLLAAIAREHDRGRRLFIATTNIDAQRAVIWDMGAIARHGTAESLELFRSVLLASASIPGVFPPVRIKVRADGRTYEELHVDGGTVNQLFFLPFDSLAETFVGAGKKRPRLHLYVIRNTKITPEYQPTDDKTFAIVGRSVATLIKSQGVGDLYRVYLKAHALRMDFNYGAIPASFVMQSKEPFDKVYMSDLFQLGFESGRAGYRWQKLPPGMTAAMARAE